LLDVDLLNFKVEECLPALARGHSGGHQRTGDGEGTVGHGDDAGLKRRLGFDVWDALGYTYSGDAVGLAAVDNGGSEGAVGGVGSDGFSDHGGSSAGGDSAGGGGTGCIGGGGTNGEGNDRETHFDMGSIKKYLKIELSKECGFERM
jgi:hypothetical protein